MDDLGDCEVAVCGEEVFDAGDEGIEGGADGEVVLEAVGETVGKGGEAFEEGICRLLGGCLGWLGGHHGETSYFTDSASLSIDFI